MSNAKAPEVPDQPVGRPRDPRIEQAVLATTVELLVAHGYADLNLAEVARRAGTTKPAIYRRWRSKAPLVHEATFPIADAHSEVPPSGTLEAELRQMVEITARMLSTPAARAAMPGLVAEFQADPLLHAALLERFREGPLAEVVGRLHAAVGAGEARAETDPAAVIEAIAGAVIFALILDIDVDLGTAWIDRTTSLLWRGIAR